MAGEGDVKETLDFNNSRASCNINLARLRDRVKDYIDKHHYDSAVFWADKLVSLSNGTMEDVYWYAQSLFLTGQYHRAANQILSRKLHKDHMCCRYLAAKCYYECRDYQEALNVLDLLPVPPTIYNQPINKRMSFANQSIVEPEQTDKCMESSISLLRGHIYEAMENRMLAIDCYREAVRQDVYCYEAFDRIVSHHMLSSQEERELIDMLPFNTQCPPEEVELIKFLYENKLKKYDKPKEAVVPEPLAPLKENLDMLVSLAERHYYNCDFRECHTITSRVLSEDLYNDQCLPIHIAVLVELKKENSIFYLAHKLVDLYPSKPVSWFAVGCYYLLINQKEPARRYLSKATDLQQSFGPAWLAFGHSFATGNEHDQAMAAYFTAAQLMKGCHLPALYIGLEYGLTNNSKLAERFFSQALSIAPEDPFVLHEMGVIAFQNEDFVGAEKFFKDALKKIEQTGKQTIVEKWEPLLNNLGHTCRKIRKYDEALQYHQQARILDPQSPATYSAIGYVYALQGDNLQAVDFFHKALSIRRDDAFSTTMLSNLIEALMTELTPGEDLEDSPVFDSTSSDLPGFSYSDQVDVKDKTPAPVLRLASKLDESSDGDGGNDNSSSLMIDEVEMGDCD